MSLVENTLKKIISKETDIKKSDILGTVFCTYLGGHLEHPAKLGFGSYAKNGEIGHLCITNDFIIFVNISFGKIKHYFKIPIKKIYVKSIKTGLKDIGTMTSNFISIYTFGGLGLGKQNVIDLPFIDGRGVKQEPSFAVKKMGNFGEILNEKLSKLSKEWEKDLNS